MKAVVIEKQGGIEGLAYREWPDPEPRPGDVVIKVHAVGMNHLDVFVRRGMPGFPVQTPFISGGDIAGEIVACGSEVTGWSVGDRVAVNPMTPDGMMGEETQGGMAEMARVPATHILPLPDGMDYVTAAAVPINFATAFRMLDTIGHMQAGEMVLIVGASGGVGTAGIQLAKRAGASVIAVTRGAAKLAPLQELGADLVVDSAAEDFSAAAWRFSGKTGVDLVMNYTGGDTWVPSLRAMKRRARLVTCGATGGFDPKTDIRYIWTRELQILGSNGYTQDDIAKSLALVADGGVRPLISHVLPATDAAEGHRLLEGREVVGKVVLTFGETMNATAPATAPAKAH
ncbi:zinc-binding dehydrogenase [Acuticoccus sp. M5D2P5]|uniref:zinc-binding dehydrogenase n=1 Tax=Acuticoccus kalidii TaxID=2910977 RepID=UPI001F2FDC5C|nr:zinc-binding dehydrogenase [Acuticoccus kalidii]MCF3934937.1 zinc-binding dehydrogenase [Acuticoccus kalidii]